MPPVYVPFHDRFTKLKMLLERRLLLFGVRVATLVMCVRYFIVIVGLELGPFARCYAANPNVLRLARASEGECNRMLL